MGRSVSILIMRKRYRIIGGVVVGVLGIGIAFILFGSSRGNDIGVQQSGVVEGFEDKDAPSSQILTPAPEAWLPVEAVLSIRDEDLGGSGLDARGCEYRMIGFRDTDGGGVADTEARSSPWIQRRCNMPVVVSMRESVCAYAGIDACNVQVRARDLAGNIHRPLKQAKSSAMYSVDWDAPTLSVLAVNGVESTGSLSITKDEAYSLTGTVSDTVSLRRCDLFLNTGLLSQLELPIGCKSDCPFTHLLPESITTHQSENALSVVCEDRARNASRKDLTVSVKEQADPSFLCRVSPAKGSVDTKFQFLLSVANPPTVPLAFLWEFGDGSNGDAQNPEHMFSSQGLFEPSVEIRYGNETRACSTAFVEVQ